jgi:pyruvate formate lyase activating enzyme
MNIDLKSFSEDFYAGLCSGKKDPVLRTIKTAVKKCHVEITTLIVTDLNDSEDEMDRIASFVSRIDRKIPFHISRYFPNFELNLPSTDVVTLEKLRKVALIHLDNVYLLTSNYEKVHTNKNNSHN